MAMQRKRRRRSGGNNNNNTNPNKHYESNGPDVRIRGSAQQILDKYLQYARDAQTSGDRVKAEGLFQHAEHYARIVAEFERLKEIERQEREQREAAKAEERAQQEAERAARAEVQAATEAESEDASDADAAAAETAELPLDAEPERKPRRSRRKRDEGEPEALKVIDGDAAESDAGEASTADESAPAKPRRRSYARRAKETAEAAVEAEDGIMKTLARGMDDGAVVEAD